MQTLLHTSFKFCGLYNLSHPSDKQVSVFKFRPITLLTTLIAGHITVSKAIAEPVITPPDAGVVLQNEKKNELEPNKPIEDNTLQLPNKPQPEKDQGEKMLVKGWQLRGNQLFPEPILQSVLASTVGLSLSVNEIRASIQRIDEYYQQQGYFARSLLPAQKIQDGIIQVVIIEGKLGKVEVNDQAGTYQHDRIKQTISSAQNDDKHLSLNDLQRGILLLNDLSGGSVSTTLKPGEQAGESDVNIKVNPKALLSGNLDYGNTGIRSVGQNQYGGTFNLNNPTNNGDYASLRMQGSSGNVYGRFTYALPIGYSGLMLGVQASGLDYSLNGAFQALEAQGSSWAGGIFASYPWLRGLKQNLNMTVGFDDRRYYNTSLQTVISNKEVQAGYIGLNGSLRDNFAGFNTLSAIMTAGTLDLSALTVDQQQNDATAKASGSYQKFLVKLSRLQNLTDDIRFFVGFNSQLATKNLDSSEKLSLGGPYGVRAYPINEALGDQGYVLNMELRYRAYNNIDVIGFIDQGGIDLHVTPWANSNPGVPGHYSLSGGGVGINWTVPNNFIIRGSMAQRIGNNPARTVAGYDSDGTLKTPHFWLTLSKSF